MRTFRKVIGLRAATLEEGALIGKLDDLQFDLEDGRIYGYRLKRGQGVFSATGGVHASAVTRLGRDLIFVTAEADVEWTGEKRNIEDGRAWASRYRKTRVISRRGAALGLIEDFLLEGEPTRVVGLLLDGNRLVRLDGRIALGRDAVVLDDPSVAISLPTPDADNPAWFSRVRDLFSRDETEEEPK